jgi:hypothetical protein
MSILGRWPREYVNVGLGDESMSILVWEDERVCQWLSGEDERVCQCWAGRAHQREEDSIKKRMGCGLLF